MYAEADPVSPSLSVTVRVTLYSPGSLNSWSIFLAALYTHLSPPASGSSPSPFRYRSMNRRVFSISHSYPPSMMNPSRSYDLAPRMRTLVPAWADAWQSTSACGRRFFAAPMYGMTG